MENVENKDLFEYLASLAAKGHHDGLCEHCDKDMLQHQTCVQGDLGFYCSEECLEEIEWFPVDNYQEDFHSDV